MYAALHSSGTAAKTVPLTWISNRSNLKPWLISAAMKDAFLGLPCSPKTLAKPMLIGDVKDALSCPNTGPRDAVGVLGLGGDEPRIATTGSTRN